jgi:hypothetical protein
MATSPIVRLSGCAGQESSNVRAGAEDMALNTDLGHVGAEIWADRRNYRPRSVDSGLRTAPVLPRSARDAGSCPVQPDICAMYRSASPGAGNDPCRRGLRGEALDRKPARCARSRIGA